MDKYGLILVLLTQSVELLIQLLMLSMVLKDRKTSVESIKELVCMLQKKIR